MSIFDKIFRGTVANDKTGDPLRTGGQIVNDNFDIAEAALLDRLLRVDSVQNIAGFVGDYDGQQISLLGWHPDSDIGGGVLYWDSTKAKTDHNGGTVFSPSVPWPSSIANYLNGIGDTDPAGLGCWVRKNSIEIMPEMFGARTDGSNCLPSLTACQIGPIFGSGGVYSISGILDILVPFDLRGSEIEQLDQNSSTCNIKFGGELFNGGVYTNNATGVAVNIDGDSQFFIGRENLDIMSRLFIHGSKVNQGTATSKGVGLQFTAMSGGTSYVSGVSVDCEIGLFETGLKMVSNEGAFINSNYIKAGINGCLHLVDIDSGVDSKKFNIGQNTFNLNLQPRSDTSTIMKIACSHSKFFGRAWDINIIPRPDQAVQFIEKTPASPNDVFKTCVSNEVDMFGIHTDRCRGAIDQNRVISYNNESNIKQPLAWSQYFSESRFRKTRNGVSGVFDTFNYIQSVDSAIAYADKRFLSVVNKTNSAGTNLGGVSPDSGFSVSDMFVGNSDITKYSFASDWLGVTLSFKEGARPLSSISTDLIGIKFLNTIRDLIIEVREAGQSSWTQVYANQAGNQTLEGFNKREIITRVNPFGGSTNLVSTVLVDGLRFRFYSVDGFYEIENIFLMSGTLKGSEFLSSDSPSVVSGNLDVGFSSSQGIIMMSPDGNTHKIVMKNGGVLDVE